MRGCREFDWKRMDWLAFGLGYRPRVVVLDIEGMWHTT